MLILAAGCGSDSIAVPEQPAACDGPLAVTVSGGTTPTFSWSPACGVSDLVVVKSTAAGDSLVWGISAPEAVRFGGPITYGNPPSFVTQSPHAAPLVPNASYHVDVYMTIGLDVVRGSGRKSFSPTL